MDRRVDINFLRGYLDVDAHIVRPEEAQSLFLRKKETRPCLIGMIRNHNVLLRLDGRLQSTMQILENAKTLCITCALYLARERSFDMLLLLRIINDRQILRGLAW